MPASSRRCSVPGRAPTPRACAARTPCSGTPPGTAPPPSASSLLKTRRRPARRAGPPTARARDQLGVARHLVGERPRRSSASGRPCASNQNCWSSSRSSSQPRSARSSCFSHDSVAHRRLYSGRSSSRMYGCDSISSIRRSTSSLVVRRPVRRDLGDRRRPVPLEPRRLLLASLRLASQHDLEGPLPERQRRQVIAVVRQVLVDQAVEPIDLPVQLLLQRDHPAARVDRTRSRAASRRRAGRRPATDSCAGVERGELPRQADRVRGRARAAALRQREVLQRRAGELVESLPRSAAMPSSTPRRPWL